MSGKERGGHGGPPLRGFWVGADPRVRPGHARSEPGSNVLSALARRVLCLRAVWSLAIIEHVVCEPSGIGEAAGLRLDLGDLDHKPGRTVLIMQVEAPALVP